MPQCAPAHAIQSQVFLNISSSPSDSSSAIAPGSTRAARRVVVIGGGPAGLMAAEALSAAGSGVSVQLYDAMPSVGRKFLLAGKGGLNLTHSEEFEPFMSRYGERRPALQPLVAAFGPPQLRDWAAALGVETFIGSSGRVFPKDIKAAPLLRAWLHRLRASGVQFFMRHRWLGWADDGAQVCGAFWRGAGPGRCGRARIGRRQLGQARL